MDVLSLELMLPTPRPHRSGDAVISSFRRRRGPASVRALLALLMAAITRPGGGGGPGGAVTVRHAGLVAYTGASIALGVALLAWTTVAIPLWPAIDAGLPGTAVDGSDGGLLLWIMFGLIGSLRVLRTPDGGTMTFHLPFIGAAMVLGGPTAGAWVAFLSTFERRELESRPWYGTLANHSVLVIAAVLGGLTTQVVGVVLGADGVGGAALVAASTGLIVLAVVSTAMGACAVMLRDGLTRSDLVGIALGKVGRINALEIGLALVFALTYAQVGWWAPLLISAAVLVLWSNEPRAAADPDTGLSAADDFRARLGAPGAASGLPAAIRPGLLMSVSIDTLDDVTAQYGQPVRNEVLREVGARIRHHKRETDIAGRTGASVLGVFLPNLDDPGIASRKADALRSALCGQIATSAGPVHVTVSIGGLVIPRGSTVLVSDALRLVDEARDGAMRGGGGVVFGDAHEPSAW